MKLAVFFPGIIVTSRFYIIHETWRRNVAMKKQLH